MAYKIFISATSVEFKDLRENLAAEIDKNPIFFPKSASDIGKEFPTAAMGKISSIEQKQFGGSPLTTLDKLDHYIKDCDIVVHLQGKLSGSHEGNERTAEDGLPSYESIINRYPNLPSKLKLDEDFLKRLTYTQWEAWLAIFHHIPLIIVEPEDQLRQPGLPADGPVDSQQEAHNNYLLSRHGLRPTVKTGVFEDLVEELAAAIIAILDADLTALDYERKAREITGETIGIGKIHTYIVSSSQGWTFSRKLGSEMDSYRDPAKPAQQVFTTELSQHEDLTPEKLDEVFEDGCLFLFYLRHADQHVYDILDFAVKNQFTSDRRRVRIIGIVDGTRKETDIADLGRVKAAGAPSNPDIYEFDASRIVFIEEGKFQNFCQYVHESFYPELTIFSKKEDFEEVRKGRIFENAMAMYAYLIPDKNERDDPDNIRTWIGDYNDDRKEWFDFLLVAHYPAGDPFAALWGNVDFRTGLGHVPFWGARAGHRSHGTATAVAGHALKMAGKLMDLERKGTGIEAMVFEAEPVDLEFMRRLVATACLKLEPPEEFPAGHSRAMAHVERNLLRQISPPAHSREKGVLTLLQQTILEIARDEDKAKVLDEELRRFRRLQVYAGNPTEASSIESRYGFRVYGFTQYAPASDSEEFSLYWQPPIVPNQDGPLLDVDENDGCFFYLFILANNRSIHRPDGLPDITAERIVDWEYRCFLGEQFGDLAPDTRLQGWDKCVAANAHRREAFVRDSKLGPVKLSPAYDVAKAVLKAVNSWPDDDDRKIIDIFSGKL